MKTLSQILRLLVLTSLMAMAQAQEVSIPDPGLNAAIRDALQKPAGPLMEQDLLSLVNLYACCRGVRSLEGLEAAHNLATLDLSANQLTSFTLPTGLTSLTTLVLGGNQLTNFSFLSGLTNLTTLYLDNNQLTNLTLPAGLTSLTELLLENNPLTTFVLPEPLAVTSLAGTIASLRSRGVSVYTYPLAVSLVSPQRTLAGAFSFTLIGPPAAYTIFNSPDLAAWNELGTLTNALGAAAFTDAEATNSSLKFYRATARLP